jgi:hypothetical protein
VVAVLLIFPPQTTNGLRRILLSVSPPVLIDGLIGTGRPASRFTFALSLHLALFLLFIFSLALFPQSYPDLTWPNSLPGLEADASELSYLHHPGLGFGGVHRPPWLSTYLTSRPPNDPPGRQTTGQNNNWWML